MNLVPFLRASLAGTALLVLAAAGAAAGTFVEALSPQERAGAGLAQLPPAQMTTLDALVQHDVTLAHEGDVTGFATTFSQRRTPKERASAGLDRLSDAQRARLDGLVARAIADRSPIESFTFQGPPPPPPPTPTVAPMASKWEVHGDLSLTVGAGSHGSSFYGTSMDVNLTDPSGKFTIDVGIAEYHGRGGGLLYGPDPFFGGPGPYFGSPGPFFAGPGPYFGPVGPYYDPPDPE